MAVLRREEVGDEEGFYTREVGSSRRTPDRPIFTSIWRPSKERSVFGWPFLYGEAASGGPSDSIYHIAHWLVWTAEGDEHGQCDVKSQETVVHAPC